MMLQDHDVICTLVNIALLRQKILALWCIFYSILDIRCSIDATSHEEANSESLILQSLDRTSYKSILRHIWSHESRFVRFCSLRIDVWSSSSESTSSRELARKLQAIHRWESYIVERARIYIAGKARSYIVERACTKTSDSLVYWAEDTSDCCEKVLKVQSSQMLRSESSCMNRSIEFSALTLAHFLCFNCMYLTRITRFQSNEW